MLYGLPEIDGIVSLARHLRLSPATVYRSAFFPRYRAVTVTVGRKTREIQIPSWRTRRIQRWILHNILRPVPVDRHATAFRDGLGVSPLAGVFKHLGYSGRGLDCLVRLCTHQGALPIGAPTSPALSNIVCYRLDRRIAAVVEPKGIVYTRYADDITLSAKNLDALNRAVPLVRKIFEEEGFRENRQKFRRMGPRVQRKVTGLILDPEQGFGIGRRQYRRLRAAVHRYRVRGTAAENLGGMLAYVKSVDEKRYQKLAKLYQGSRLSPRPDRRE
jgi:RNA-directed DNA polymerase